MKKKAGDLIRNLKKNPIVREFKQTFKKYRREFFRVLSLAMIFAFIQLLLPIQLRQLIFSVQNGASVAEITIRFLMILLIMLWSTVANIYFYIYTDRFGGKYLSDLLCSAEQKIENARYSDIEKIGFDRLKHILYADALDMFRIIGNVLPKLICAFIITFFSLLLSLFFRPLLTLFLFLSFVFGVGISFFARTKIYHAASKTNSMLKEVSHVLHHYVDSISTVKANGWTGHYQRETEKTVSSFIADSERADREIYFFQGIISNYSTLIQIVISVILALSISENSVVDLAFYTVLFSIIIKQGEMVEMFLQQLHRGAVGFSNMNEIMTLPEVFGSVELQPVLDICVEDLEFRYSNSQNSVFDHFNFKAERGDAVRISGGNGRGKSTLLKLFLRFYPPKEGKILFNGQPADEYDSRFFYRQVLYIGQDEQLINGSVEDYLKLAAGGEVPLSDSVLSDLKMGEVHGEIRDLGKNLSGGQRKKLLFAKMKLRSEHASVILVDELDSAFDVETRAMFEDWLNERIEQGDKIVFVIQHNAASRIRCNKTIELR